MGLGHTEGFLCVVFKIGLCKLIGVVVNNADGVVVGTYGTVAAKTPELTTDDTRLTVGEWLNISRQMGHIVVDTDGEVVLWSFAC